MLFQVTVAGTARLQAYIGYVYYRTDNFTDF